VIDLWLLPVDNAGSCRLVVDMVVQEDGCVDDDGDLESSDRWEDLMDGKIRKRVVKPGSGERPEMQQDVMCSVSIFLTSEAAGFGGSSSSSIGAQADEEQRCGPPLGEGELLQTWAEKRFRIGEGEAVPMLELCLRYMREGEECEAFGTPNMAFGPVGLKARSPQEKDVSANVDVRMRITLHTCYPIGGELSWNDKIQHLSWRKANGNDHYKSKDFAKAARCYAAGIEIFGDDFEPPEHLAGGRGAAKAMATKTLADCGANLAAVFLEQGNYLKARDVAAVALAMNPDNLKVHFRLAKAHLALNDLDDCEAALEKAQALDPEDGAVKRLALDLRRAKQEYAKKCKSLGAKLFEVDWASQRPEPKKKRKQKKDIEDDADKGGEDRGEDFGDTNGARLLDADSNGFLRSLLSCCRKRRD